MDCSKNRTMFRCQDKAIEHALAAVRLQGQAWSLLAHLEVRPSLVTKPESIC